ncbi:N-acetyltransferase family protein [Mesosutterella sp. OilRF-GAM-744-9]|uniref:N-acetyltransferase family protein n=1 Tax=Mesosutterella porci TaxID=2915351 RepID=A0ABS9MPC2_9BURK|nr:GNAT family N-acetyltransferase [Mesosutterella sp. oilRF-744-WT-GAM-9]MCG5030105.1 N-acetyltransferase family protein [Mesosutterella sp. oilRF-744-WT-GAM-9]
MNIRRAVQADLPKLLEIYNYEVINGVATFDTEPFTLAQRQPWFDAHNVANHPLIVAEVNGVPAGYATLSSFNSKAAYDSTVELSIYVDQACRGKHVGRELMSAILDLAREDSRTHRVVSIITGTNEASIALHKKFGFRYAGTITEAGFKKGRYLDVGYWELAV